MVRGTYVQKYNDDVHDIVYELSNTCKNAMLYPGNLLVC
jgi:hypothetical protein